MGTIVLIIIVVIGFVFRMAKSMEKKQQDSGPQTKPLIRQASARQSENQQKVFPKRTQEVKEDRSMIEKSNEIQDQIRSRSLDTHSQVMKSSSDKITVTRSQNKNIMTKESIAESLILSECLAKPRAIRPHSSQSRYSQRN